MIKMKNINRDEKASNWLINKLNTGEKRINELRAISKETISPKQKAITK